MLGNLAPVWLLCAGRGSAYPCPCSPLSWPGSQHSAPQLSWTQANLPISLSEPSNLTALVTWSPWKGQGGEVGTLFPGWCLLTGPASFLQCWIHSASQQSLRKDQNIKAPSPDTRGAKGKGPHLCPQVTGSKQEELLEGDFREQALWSGVGRWTGGRVCPRLEERSKWYWCLLKTSIFLSFLLYFSTDKWKKKNSEGS